jgi:hypothetical protein
MDDDNIPWVRHIISTRKIRGMIEKFLESLGNEMKTLLKISPIYPDLGYLSSQISTLKEAEKYITIIYDTSFEKIYELNPKDRASVIHYIVGSCDSDNQPFIDIDTLDWLNTPRSQRDD